jgi:putative drug exporter of the RND superfamily
MQSLARFTISHRRMVIAAWVFLLVVSLGTASTLKNRFSNNLTLPNTGTQRAADLLHSHFPTLAGDSDQIVFHSNNAPLSAPAVRARVAASLRAVKGLAHVAGVVSPYANPRAVSRDGTTGFATLTFDERGDALPQDAVKHVIRAAEAAGGGGLEIALGGYAIEESQRPTVGAATAIGIGAAMVVLFLSFGSLLAMGLPIVIALFGLGTSMGLIAALTHGLKTPDFASELALLIGLGVGVDYALFVVTRFRDTYLRNGGDVNEAVVTAMNTAGRSVAFAGATVVIAVLGLFVVGVQLFYGVALATSLTVLLMLAASLTLLPALLSLAGPRIGRKAAGRTRSGRAGGGWARWVAIIQRAPALTAVGATLFLLLLAVPVLSLRLASSDASNDRSTTTTHRAYDLLTAGFGVGFNGPLQVAVRVPGDRAPGALPTLASALRKTPGVAAVSTPLLNGSRDTAEITVFPTTAPQSKQTYDLVRQIRRDVIPAVAQVTGLTAFVGGSTASQVDFAHVLSRKLPLFIAVVVVLSALLLLAVFRSLVIPLQAALMNLLSIGAALGVVQAVFERGWAAGILGVTRSPVEAFIPVIVFAIVFGLSMDYEVFLVSRIHEEWTHGSDHAAAIRNGVMRTGRVITAAAAVMVVVFASFAASDNHILKLFGLALATAVFLDAVVIRSILLPAVLALVGKRTWSFPRSLDRILPRLAIEPPQAEFAEVMPFPNPVPTEVS